jgi:hypothetical protein
MNRVRAAFPMELENWTLRDEKTRNAYDGFDHVG